MSLSPMSNVGYMESEGMNRGSAMKLHCNISAYPAWEDMSCALSIMKYRCSKMLASIVHHWAMPAGKTSSRPDAKGHGNCHPDGDHVILERSRIEVLLALRLAAIRLLSSVAFACPVQQHSTDGAR